MKPLVSVVMATFNGSKYLEEQVRSLLGQSYENLEVIIADDCSTDNSLRIAERFAESDPRVQVHRNAENVGLVKNFIGALRYTRGELICFSDQDDVWKRNKVEILSPLILRDPRNMLAYSDMEICDEALKVTHPSFWHAAGIGPREGHLGELALLRNIMPGCSLMFRREVQELMQMISEDCSFMHDHQAFIAAASLGRIVYTRKRLVQYRQHPQNNIGAFYPSKPDRKRLFEQLKREIDQLSGKLPGNLSRLRSFVQEDHRKNILLRLSFFRYYLFLRNETFRDKLFGLCECFSPELYRFLRGIRDSHSL